MAPPCSSEGWKTSIAFSLNMLGLELELWFQKAIVTTLKLLEKTNVNTEAITGQCRTCFNRVFSLLSFSGPSNEVFSEIR